MYASMEDCLKQMFISSEFCKEDKPILDNPFQGCGSWMFSVGLSARTAPAVFLKNVKMLSSLALLFPRCESTHTTPALTLKFF